MKPVIGLVGGIGSGKSTVARLLGERGGLVVEADPLAHQALRDPEVRDKVVFRFGPRSWTLEQLQARERAQLSMEEKARRADATVDNGGTIDETARQLDELLKRWNLSEELKR